MTVLVLSCSMSWSQNNTFIPFTGVVDSTYNNDDSVLIPIKYIKIANAKMIELKHEKEINGIFVQIIRNDSICISNLNNNLRYTEIECSNNINNIKKQRNIARGASGVLLVLLLIAIL